MNTPTVYSTRLVEYVASCLHNQCTQNGNQCKLKFFVGQTSILGRHIFTYVGTKYESIGPSWSFLMQYCNYLICLQIQAWGLPTEQDDWV